MKKLKVAFFGTPDFSIPSLELLFNHPNIEIAHIVTMPDRPSGRGQKLQSPPVAQFAQTHKIPLIQTTNICKDEEALNLLKETPLDCIIVLAFAQFLNQDILDFPKLGCFNIHTSILPKYRGAAPIQYALLNSDKTTGVSIQKMVLKMDAGDLVHFNEIGIGENEDGGQLYTRLKFLAALSLNEFLEKLLSGKIEYTPQLSEAIDSKNEISFAPTIKKTDGYIDFSKSSFKAINSKLKAFTPWPGIYCFLGSKRLKIFSVEVDPINLAPGETDFSQNSILVGCLDCTVRLPNIQLEGKKPSSDTNLLNGLINKINEIEINP